MSRSYRLCEIAPRRIALIKPSALGDIVHSLPVLTGLRQRFPDAHITWVVNRGYEALLRGHPDLNATLPFDRGALGQGWQRAASAWGQLLTALHAARFDLVIDLQGLLRTGIMTLATGARRRVGLSTAREGATFFYTDVIPVPNPQAIHAVDRYWQAAAAVGAGSEPPGFHLPLDATASRWAKALLHDCPRPWVAVGAGSRWQTKRWSPEHFVSLLHQARASFGGTAILVGGTEDIPLARAIRIQLPGYVRDLTGCTTLPQLAAVLGLADVMLANDTGPLHLAVALGRPVIAPYTCTKVSLTGPYGTPGGIESRIWCQGSYRKRCPRMECMTELTPDRLWPMLHEVLQSWESRLPQSA